MNRTERDLINAFWALLGEKPYNKITVQDIVDRCEVNRNTFYYHFQDIPSMAEESFRQWVDKLISQNGGPLITVEHMEQMFHSFMETRPILLNLYRSAQRETFQRGLFRLSEHISCRVIDNLSKGYQVPAEDREAAIMFCRCMLTGAFLEWMESGMKEDTLEKILQVYNLFGGLERPALLKNAVPLSREGAPSAE